jgi:hypothetical protein
MTGGFNGATANGSASDLNATASWLVLTSVSENHRLRQQQDQEVQEIYHR